MDGIGVLIKSSGRRSFNEYDHISFPPQRLRRKTWCGFSNETDRCFFKIVEVNDEQVRILFFCLFIFICYSVFFVTEEILVH